MNEGLQMLRGVGVLWPELLGAAGVDFHYCKWKRILSLASQVWMS